MLNRDNTVINSYKTNAGRLLKKDAKFDLRDSNVQTYIVLRKQTEKDGPIYLDEETSTYIDIEYYNKKIDWTKKHDDGRNTRQKIKAKQCSQDYFGDDKFAKTFYEGWTGFSLICPDLQKDDHLWI